jgi:hypothetical protein
MLIVAFYDATPYGLIPSVLYTAIFLYNASQLLLLLHLHTDEKYLEFSCYLL